MQQKWIIWMVLSLVACIKCSAQYTVDKLMGPKNEALLDSMKKTQYPYMLPIYGQKVYNKGFSLPLPAGLSVQYLWQQSDIVISNLQVGFNGGSKYSLDNVIRFEKATATSNGVNIRPDFWLFPFLNVYALFAQSKTSTAVHCGLWVPDSSDWHKAVDFNTKANFNATTFGFGFTPTFGIGGFFVAIDMNFTWSDIQELEKPAYIFVLGPRIGKNFKFEKERSLAVWAGGFRVQMNSGTSGSLNVADLFPTQEWQLKIDTGFTKVANAQSQVNSWWNGLNTVEQKNPVNIAKYQTANTALATAGQFLNGASQVVTNTGNSTVQYSLDKAPKDKWNFIIGSQFQIDKRFMIRAEYGFLSGRHQFLGGLQYRFGF